VNSVPKTYPLNTNFEGSLHSTEVVNFCELIYCEKCLHILHRAKISAIFVHFCLHLVVIATLFAPWKIWIAHLNSPTPKILTSQLKLHWFQFCARDLEIFYMSSWFYGVRELKYAITIFKGAKGVFMTTKFRQKYAKIVHILLLYKMYRHFLHVGLF